MLRRLPMSNGLQRGQAMMYETTHDQYVHELNRSMLTSQNGATLTLVAGQENGVTLTKYPYHQVELDQLWYIANVNIEAVFDQLEKTNDTEIN